MTSRDINTSLSSLSSYGMGSICDHAVMQLPPHRKEEEPHWCILLQQLKNLWKLGDFFVCVKRFWVQWIQLLGEQMRNICQMAFRQNFLMFGESMANGSILTFKKVRFSSYKCLCPSRIYIFVILYVYMFCKKQLWRCCIICNTYKTPTFTTYVYIMSIQLKTNPIFLSKYVLQGEE